jgi:hypothetical protein
MRLRLGQSRAGSLAEAVANVVAGYVLAIAVQGAAYPLFGITTSLTMDSIIAALFTVTSLARSYLIRRLIEALGQQGCLRTGNART